MNQRIQDYIETDFGIKRSIDKAEAKRRREMRKKKRLNKEYFSHSLMLTKIIINNSHPLTF
jgi:hypothetical protein